MDQGFLVQRCDFLEEPGRTVYIEEDLSSSHS